MAIVVALTIDQGVVAMPTFQYEARDKSGNLVTGSMEASDERTIAAQLREAGFWVTAIRRTSRSAPGTHASPLDGLFLRVRLVDLAVFFRELHTMVKAGMSLYRALDVQANNAANPRLRRILREMAPAVLEGKPLSGEMAKFPTVFSPLLIGLVKAGEVGGMLERTLLDAANYLDREIELRRKIHRALIYPAIVCIVAFLVGAFVPVATDVVNGRWIALFVSILTNLIALLPFIAPFVALWLINRMMSPTAGVRKAIDALKLYVPLWGSVARKFALAKFCRALSALYGAGLPLSQSLPLAADACGNAAIGSHVKSIVPHVEKGTKLSDLLRQSPYFTPMVIQMMVTGEETGSLDAVLAHVADHYEAEAEVAVNQMVIVGSVLLFLLVAFFVVLPRLIGFYTGYFHNIFQEAEKIAE
ncbi:MAG: type II secretion system F family protein [Abditibacteriales bacterium]|nr:type II secretion system F family protein [Abditibacteriales bacterium]MDW8365951.1 type II secretion system F family protein [Abditibacteriales bacterium]